jgi:hypothetical protein
MSLLKTLHKQRMQRHADWAARAVPDTGIDMRDGVPIKKPLPARKEAVVIPINAEPEQEVPTELEIIEEPTPPQRVTVDLIINVVCRQYQVRKMDMLSERRTKDLVVPRHIAMYLASRLTKNSLPEIGRRIGGRDHSTVLHAQRKISAIVLENRMFALQLESLAQGILSGDIDNDAEPAFVGRLEIYDRARSWTDEELDVVRTMAADGYYPARISRKLRRTAEAVRNAARRHGIAWPKTSTQFPVLSVEGNDVSVETTHG